MKKIVYIFLLLAVPLSTVDAYTFTRTLTIGSEGVDVQELQKLLNSNPQTQVADTGSGAPGSETTYFGEKTRQAVIKMQNLFASEILIPVGLTYGTGFIGKSTLNFLNSSQNTILPLSTTETLNEITSSETESETTTQKSSGIPQFFISTKIAKPGEYISIGTQHKINAIDFYLNDEKMSKKCSTSYTCQIFINKNTSAGIYTVSTSDSELGETSITILSSNTPKPEINLKSLSLTGENLIKGSNLSDTITIYTMYGSFTSETENDSFILEFPKDTNANPDITEGIFYVENENGLLSDILEIDYEF